MRLILNVIWLVLFPACTEAVVADGALIEKDGVTATAWLTTDDVLGANVESPEYCAVIGYVP